MVVPRRPTVYRQVSRRRVCRGQFPLLDRVEDVNSDEDLELPGLDRCRRVGLVKGRLIDAALLEGRKAAFDDRDRPAELDAGHLGELRCPLPRVLHRVPPRRFAQFRRVLDREGDVPNDDVVAAGRDGSIDYRGCTLNATQSDADDMALL